MSILESFGQAVRERRHDLGLSQEALGYRCGLDRTYVSGIERGVRNPTLKVMLQLAEGLEVRLSELAQRMEEAGG